MATKVNINGIYELDVTLPGSVSVNVTPGVQSLVNQLTGDTSSPVGGGNVTVTGIQTTPVSSTPPIDQQILIYSASAGKWVPTTFINGASYYLDSAASDILTYDTLIGTIPTAVQTSLSAAATSGSGQVLIGAWATSLGNPDTLLIPEGQWTINFFASVTSINQGPSIVVKMYSRTTGGVETQLWSMTIPLTSTAITYYDQSIQNPAFALNASDRLVCKVYFQTPSAASQTGTLYFDGSVNNSHFHLPGSSINTLREEQINAQSGTSYTFLDSDRGKLVTFNNGFAMAATLPQAGSSSQFVAGWFVDISNLNGGGVLTITPTTSTIDGFTSITVPRNQGLRIVSDGTNYFTQRGLAAAAGLSSYVQFNTNGELNASSNFAWDNNNNNLNVLVGGIFANTGFSKGDNSNYFVSATHVGNNYGLYYDATNLYVQIWTNSAARVTVDSSGKVGIGKIPSTLLDVNGAISAAGNISLTGSLIFTSTTPQWQLSMEGTSLVLRDNTAPDGWFFALPDINVNNTVCNIFGGGSKGTNLMLQVNGRFEATSYSSVGGTPISTVGFYVQGSPMTGASQFAVDINPTFDSTATTAAYCLIISPVTAAAAYTIPSLYGAYIGNPTLGAGSSVTTYYGLYVVGTSTVAGTNYAIYVNGTNLSYFGGPIQVQGIATFNNSVGFNGNVNIVNNAVISPQGTATNVANFSSFSFSYNVSYWNGTAAATDGWTTNVTLGAGTNPGTSLNVLHSGNAASGISQTDTFRIVESPAATSGQNINTPQLQLTGHYWNGSASATENWSWIGNVGTGTNPTSTLLLQHGGTSGALTVDYTIASVFKATSININGGTAILDSTGKFTTYNSLTTIGGGVPVLVAQANATAQAANIGTTALFTATNGGTYRFVAVCVLTQAATTSSTLPGIQVNWTDADTSAVNTQTVTGTSTANTVGTYGAQAGFINGVATIQVKAGTVINYDTTAYASSGATAMQYAIHIKLEYLGA